MEQVTHTRIHRVSTLNHFRSAKTDKQILKTVPAGHRYSVVECLECECSADLDIDFEVDVIDLLAIIDEWGPCVGCATDFDGNGEVDILDLLVILDQWGSCPEPEALTP